MPAIEVADLMISPAKLYFSPEGTTLPADTVPYGGAWPTAWDGVGVTSSTLVVAYTYDTVDADYQEFLSPIDRAKSKEEAKFECTLGQIDLDIIQLTWSGTNINTPASTGVAGVQAWNVGGKSRLQKYQWGFEGLQIDSSGNELPVRGFIYRATPAAGGQLEFGKANWTGTALSLMGLADPNRARGDQLFTIRRVIAPAL
jgi:hypothetical protein